MLELNEAIAKMLELLNKRLQNLEPQEISLKSLEPLAKSLTEALGGTETEYLRSRRAAVGHDGICAQAQGMGQ